MSARDDTARAPADLDRIEDALMSVEGAALLLNMVVIHGEHLGGKRARQTAVWHANRLLAADVSELRRVLVHSATE